MSLLRSEPEVEVDHKEDREILRELGRRVAGLAALPVQQETVANWKALNGLHPVRPMVAIDQLPWHEMADDPALVTRCQDPFNRGLEVDLRRLLFSWEHFRADMVVEPVLLIPKVLRLDGFGIEMHEVTQATDAGNDVVSHHFFDQLAEESDADRIRTPNVWLDEALTAELEGRAHAIFDGVLPVRMQGWVPSSPQWPGLRSQPETRALVNDWPEEVLSSGGDFWDIITFWRGADAVLLDLADRPEHMHRIVDRLVTAYLGMLDQMEAKALLGHSMSLVHCTPAFTDELPHDGFDPERPRAEDIWTMGMAQVFTSASPAMFREFEVTYAKRWFERFGLGYYGCCDVLDRNIENIRAIPNVRKISISPWSSVERSADGIGGDFVMSRKANPALLAMDGWEPDAVRRELRSTVEVCRRAGTPVELILKDVSTIRRQRHRLEEWVAIAMDVAQG
jgi:hypothetical protein